MHLDLDVGKKKGIQQVAHHGMLHYGKDETSRDFLPAVNIKSVVLWSHISLVHVSSTLRPLRLSGSHLCELVADDFSDEISDFGQHWDPNLGMTTAVRDLREWGPLLNAFSASFTNFESGKITFQIIIIIMIGWLQSRRLRTSSSHNDPVPIQTACPGQSCCLCLLKGVECI